MGCRSFLPSWKDAEGHFENNGRCNLGVVTLNLPRMALESAGNMTKFWEIFMNVSMSYTMHYFIV